ncbi:MAG TPA: type III-B CRISPR module RAMP protein Cmr6 [Aquificaceae bacterium]|nr:type III-B CRISPR module RAMP protein Cmr6 [Aquificaceae bacterium]HIQ48015.1 type III-B CRISPR module RAMP protein Cmr6 [Aquifex aeolicus]
MTPLKELKEIIEKEKYSNPHLAFYKLHALKFVDEKKVDKEKIEIDKKEFLEQFLKNLDCKALEQSRKRLEKNIDKIYSSFDKKEGFRAKVGYRFVAGMGYPSVIENGFLFHFTYGIPYIPAETLKGLVRATFLYSYFPEKDEKELKSIAKSLEEGKHENKEIQKKYEILFGTKEKEAKLIYLDAFPVSLEKKHFKVDVMNPHYSEYYSNKGEKPPIEWENPIPIFFLTLEDVEFCFKICLGDSLTEGKKYLEEARELLIKGLETFGVGGKRRKGYGWFVISS